MFLKWANNKKNIPNTEKLKGKKTIIINTATLCTYRTVLDNAKEND